MNRTTLSYKAEPNVYGPRRGVACLKLFFLIVRIDVPSGARRSRRRAKVVKFRRRGPIKPRALLPYLIVAFL
jgi:hypothetical protein